MEWIIQDNNRSWAVQAQEPVDLSSTYGAPEAEPRAWGAPPVKVQPVAYGNWIGAVKAGAAINFYDISLNPHGNGTHTEGYGHLSPEHESVNAQLRSWHCLAQLSWVEPHATSQGLMIRREDLHLASWPSEAEALVLAVSMRFPQDFSGAGAPFLEPALANWLREQGVKHLLTNLPSVDPEEDGGALAAHKAYWNYPEAPRSDATITELARIPDHLKEGIYWLNLQVAPIHNDAAPSRPVLYPCRELSDAPEDG